jgi:hypothetical protein
MNIDFPLRFDGRGRTADVSDDDHIRDMIEQVLLTAPGERVNRPTFGSGTAQLVFAPNSSTVAAAQQRLIQAGLQQWLPGIIAVKKVEVTNQDSTLQITVQYTIVQSQQQQIAQFSFGGPAS